MSKIPKILLAPLNWGLGHATRCMPIINTLLEAGVEPILASDGQSLKVLAEAYPQLYLIELPAYNVRYDNGSMIWQIGKQVPKIIKAIQDEKKQVARIVQKYNIDIIISDNRYGVISKDTYNIFISHQLQIKIPNPFLERLVAIGNHYFIKKYDECWVPDFEDQPRISGSLSERLNLQNVKYIGGLSRMKHSLVEQKIYDAIIVLSGPEPQRTKLQEILLDQIRPLKGRFLMVLGKTDFNLKALDIPKHVEVKTYMNAQYLNEAILASQYVICRSGYSSLMDLMKLGKSALLIPTPQQTEQEYLAEFLSEQGLFITQSQDAIDVEKGLEDLSKISPQMFRPSTDYEQYKTIVHNLLKGQH